MPPTDPIAAEIEAEIADHLATSAERFQSQGLATDLARQKSQEKFGDPAAITRRCYWIKQGDALMFRTAVIVLLALLCIALGITTLTSYQSQRITAQQMAVLSEQLKTLAEQQKAPAAPQVSTQPKVLEIVGRAYSGSPDKPAGHTRITIIDVKDGSKVRNIATDSDGNFNSGPLGGGEYSLVAETDEKEQGGRFTRKVQSAPIGVYPGLEVPRQEFDTRFHPAAIKIETSRPLPSLTVEDRYTIDTRLMVKVYIPQDRSYLWTTEEPQPLSWPVYPRADSMPQQRGAPGRAAGRGLYDILANRDFERPDSTTLGRTLLHLPAGKIQLAAAVLTDVFPIGYERPAIPQTQPGNIITDENRELWSAAQEWRGISNAFDARPASLNLQGRESPTKPDNNNDLFFWYTKGLGNIWLTHLLGPAEESRPPRPRLISSNWFEFDAVSVILAASDKTTRIQLAIPDDLESQIRQLVDSTTDPAEFAKATLGEDPSRSSFGSNSRQQNSIRRGTPWTSPFFRKAEITIVGTEPMTSSEP